MISSKRLWQRAGVLRALRSFFFDRGFLEVDTPIRQPVIIPERYIEPIRSGDCYLQTSPELCMKRLLAKGCSKIFQITPCFRKNERGRRHLEEFTMLEWYRTDSNYRALMDDCEALLCVLADKLSAEWPKEDLFAGIDLCSPWEKITVADAFHRFSPTSLSKALEKDIFDEVLVEYIEPQLGKEKPVFLVDYPVELGSLARCKDGSEGVVERFELYLDGIEIANGFSELTDPEEQRTRFAGEIASIKQSWDKHIQMPERFLEDLENLQSAAGIALGVDRLFMLAFGIESIEDAVSFFDADFL